MSKLFEKNVLANCIACETFLECTGVDSDIDTSDEWVATGGAVGGTGDNRFDYRGS